MSSNYADKTRHGLEAKKVRKFGDARDNADWTGPKSTMPRRERVKG